MSFFPHWIKYACWFFLWVIKKKERNTVQKILFILTPCVHYSRLVYSNGMFTGLKKIRQLRLFRTPHLT